MFYNVQATNLTLLERNNFFKCLINIINSNIVVHFLIFSVLILGIILLGGAHMVSAPIRWMLLGIQTCVEVRQQNQNHIFIVANPNEEQEN